MSERLAGDDDRPAERPGHPAGWRGEGRALLVDTVPAGPRVPAHDRLRLRRPEQHRRLRPRRVHRRVAPRAPRQQHRPAQRAPGAGGRGSGRHHGRARRPVVHGPQPVRPIGKGQAQRRAPAPAREERLEGAGRLGRRGGVRSGRRDIPSGQLAVVPGGEVSAEEIKAIDDRDVTVSVEADGILIGGSSPQVAAAASA